MNSTLDAYFNFLGDDTVEPDWASIFHGIDTAIRVAAADHPDAQCACHDAIAERLCSTLIGLPHFLHKTPRHPTLGQSPLLLGRL